MKTVINHTDELNPAQFIGILIAILFLLPVAIILVTALISSVLFYIYGTYKLINYLFKRFILNNQAQFPFEI